MLIWGITSGAAGMNAQVDGVGEALAEACGATYVRKTFTRPAPLCWLPGWITWGCAPQLKPPFPDVVISCGRRSVAFALALKKKHGCTLVHLQDPRISPRYFDLVVAQEHDRLRATNVITTFAALHAITPAKLAAAKAAFPQLAALPSPRIAVLIGGNTNRYTASSAAINDMLAQLGALKGSVMITPSRRTPSELKDRLATLGAAYVYDGTGANPYLAMLACADEIAATNDSVSMMSEAAYTGKPLHILNWQGHQGTTPAQFAQALRGKTLTDERAEVVRRILAVLKLKN